MILFRLLGPVTVSTHATDSGPFGTPILRALLTALLQEPNQFVTTARIAGHLWNVPPASSAANLRTHATRLRTELEAREPGLSSRLQTRRGGTGGTAYQLIVGPGELDTAVVADLVAQGHRALGTGNPADAIAPLHAAQRLWRGPAGDDLPDTPPLRQHAEILTEQRLRLREDLLAARLALGHSATVISELREAAKAAPLRERVCELLMRGLYGDGDAAGALATYNRYRRTIATEIGALPSPRLKSLYLAILRHDDTMLKKEPLQPRQPQLSYR
jgi:DNA-binding SARP family transcriptional activator